MAPYWVSAFGQISYRSFAPQATGSKLIRNLLGLSGWVRRWKKWLVRRWYVSVTQTGFFNKFRKLKWKLPTKKLTSSLLAFEYSVSFYTLDFMINLRCFWEQRGFFMEVKENFLISAESSNLWSVNALFSCCLLHSSVFMNKLTGQP